MLKPRFTTATIKALLDRKIKALEQAIIMRFSMLGDQCVNEARSMGDYTDQTGNLRSSIGYVIVVNGQIIKESGFEMTGSGSGGIVTGQAYANQLASNFRTGYALIVVAGMDYAFYVEATGANVLSSAEHLAKVQMPIMMNQLKMKLK